LWFPLYPGCHGPQALQKDGFIIMSKTILHKVEGWTPIIDAIAMEHGLVTAAVFGRMWRFCQMSDGICKASLDKIASYLGIDKSTVMRHAKILVDAKFLEDTTPNIKNKPHIYRDTGKAQLVSSTVAHVAERNVSVAERNVSVAECNVSVAESQLKKVIKKQVKDKKTLRANARTRDARLDHPVLIAYNKTMRLHIPIALRDKVIDIVGDDPDRLTRWDTTLITWLGQGYNKTNINGLLDVFQNGLSKTKGALTNTERSLANLQSVIAEREGENNERA
jgi:DNA-binding transcriptional ArsR family regulator